MAKGKKKLKRTSKKNSLRKKPSDKRKASDAPRVGECPIDLKSKIGIQLVARQCALMDENEPMEKAVTQRLPAGVLELLEQYQDDEKLEPFFQGLIELNEDFRVDNLANEIARCDLDSPAIPFTTMEDIAKEIVGVMWLWLHYIPYGMVTMLVGAPGIGKSSVVLGGIVKALLLGLPLLDGFKSKNKHTCIIWWDTEYSHAITIERMNKWGVPKESIILPPGESLESGSLDHSEFISFLREQICQYKPSLLVVDALRGAHGQDENSSQIAKVMNRLVELAKDTNIPVLAVHHTRKIDENRPITMNDVRGSNAQVALARSVIAISQADRSSDVLKLEVIKSNVAKAPKPIGFRFDEEEGVVSCDVPEFEKRKSRLVIAEDFLLEVLADGPIDGNRAKKQAEVEGIAEKTLKRAKKNLKVVSDKRADGWYWELPELIEE